MPPSVASGHKRPLLLAWMAALRMSTSILPYLPTTCGEGCTQRWTGMGPHMGTQVCAVRNVCCKSMPPCSAGAPCSPTATPRVASTCRPAADLPKRHATPWQACYLALGVYQAGHRPPKQPATRPTTAGCCHPPGPQSACTSPRPGPGHKGWTAPRCPPSQSASWRRLRPA